MKIFRQILDISTLVQLPRHERRIIFYSEGRAYWPHLEGVLRAFLEQSNTPVCYISSGQDDPAFLFQHPRLRTFHLDESFIRNWFFENVDTDVLVMTMPDLDCYQVKRSKYPVHYVYIHHALVSCHRVYRPHAFDHFDTIFCAGPHHVKELRALEALYQSKEKRLVEHGYGRLDAILSRRKQREANQIPHILIAPSWGEQGLIETIGDEVVRILLKHQYQVTLRPHPQTVKFAKQQLSQIVNAHQHNPLFELETNVASQDSLHQSDLMISDWSGAALDYAFGLEKPVLFIDIPKKTNNPDYHLINLIPFEESIREHIGQILPLDQINALPTYIEALIKNNDWQVALSQLRETHTFNVGHSDTVGARVLMELLA